jgi:hypothetical protein
MKVPYSFAVLVNLFSTSQSHFYFFLLLYKCFPNNWVPICLQSEYISVLQRRMTASITSAAELGALAGEIAQLSNM